MRDVILEFNSEIDGSHEFCALMLFMCCIVCLICSGSNLHVTCMLPFGMSFVCVKNNVCEYGVCNVYICWWLNVREISLSGCSELCPVCFSIVVIVCLFFQSLYLMRVLIVMIMGRSSELSACVVCHVVRLYNGVMSVDSDLL